MTMLQTLWAVLIVLSVIEIVTLVYAVWLDRRLRIVAESAYTIAMTADTNTAIFDNRTKSLQAQVDALQHLLGDQPIEMLDADAPYYTEERAS